MALAPSASAPPAGGMMPPDPGMGVGGPPPAPAAAAGKVVCTISEMPDGTYMVAKGDEPDAEAGDMSGDDAAAMGGDMGGDMGGGGAGQPAASVGEALKLAMNILNASKSSAGAPGSSDDQLSAGYGADKNPTPAKGGGPAMKY